MSYSYFVSTIQRKWPWLFKDAGAAVKILPPTLFVIFPSMCSCLCAKQRARLRTHTHKRTDTRARTASGAVKPSRAII